MKLEFLGTGAADWRGTDERGELRRLTSTLIDDCLLIDVTGTVLDMIVNPGTVTHVFFTHSHGDHFSLEALKTLAPCRVYAHESWAGDIRGEGLSVTPLTVGAPVEAAGFTVTPLPANHSTERADEQPLHYLIEKGGRRVLYATDGAWMLNGAHHIIGSRALDAAVFDATIGDGREGDYRIFEHNSVDMVRLMLKTMLKTGRLKQDAPVFLTHMARTLHGTQREIEEITEKPFVVCYDGMTREI